MAGRIRGGLRWLSDGTIGFVTRIHGVKYSGRTEHTDPERAREFLLAFRQGISDQSVGIERPGTHTFEDALQGWRAAKTGDHTEKHLDDTVSQIRTHAALLLPCALEEIKNAHIVEIRKTYLETPLLLKRTDHGGNAFWKERRHTNGGANKLVKQIRAVFTWAIEEGWIEFQPWRVKPLKVDKLPRPVLAPVNVQHFLAAVDESRNPNVRMLVRAMLAMGLREGEALKMRWERLSFERGTYVALSKTGKSRILDVPTWYLTLLDTLDRQPSGWIFPSEDGEPHRTGYTRKAIQKGCEAVGMPLITPHRLRATFATTLKDIKTDLKAIQGALGHSSLKTTEIYLEESINGLRSAVEKAGAAMGFETRKCRKNTPPVPRQSPNKLDHHA